jgi:hypothetical protein
MSCRRLSRRIEGSNKPGLYRLDDGTLRTLAAVGNPDPLQFSDVWDTETGLKPLVEASGGSMMWLADNAGPEIRSVRPAAPPAARTIQRANLGRSSHRETR